MASEGQSDDKARESSAVKARHCAQAQQACKGQFLHLQYEDERVHVMALWGTAEVMNWVKLKALLRELTAAIISIISSSSVVINDRRFGEAHWGILFWKL